MRRSPRFSPITVNETAASNDQLLPKVSQSSIFAKKLHRTTSIRKGLRSKVGTNVTERRMLGVDSCLIESQRNGLSTGLNEGQEEGQVRSLKVRRKMEFVVQSDESGRN